VRIERASPDDAAAAALLAERKRVEYESYSPVFWRVAPDATARHEPFLRFCLGSDDFTSIAAREGDALAGIAIAHHRVGPPPLATDDAWLVDDFFVADGRWDDVGDALLAELERHAPLVVLSARRDEPKRRVIAARGYARAASWWVFPVEPGGEAELPAGAKAVTGPAPPVYDPGGQTALALRLDAQHVPAYTAWAAARGTVLAIVPARATDTGLEAALERAGYAPASDWWAR